MAVMMTNAFAHEGEAPREKKDPAAAATADGVEVETPSEGETTLNQITAPAAEHVSATPETWEARARVILGRYGAPAGVPLPEPAIFGDEGSVGAAAEWLHDMYRSGGEIATWAGELEAVTGWHLILALAEAYEEATK